MLRRSSHIAALFAAAWLVASCGAPTRQPANGVSAAYAETAAPETPLAEPDLTLPPPAAIADNVQPLADEPLRKAHLSLEDVLVSLPDPPVLKATAPPQPTQPVPAAHPAAAKAYIAGRMAFLNGDLAAAITELEVARSLHPRDPAVLRLLGIVHFARRTDARAVQYLGEAVRLQPDDAEALFLLGNAARRRQSWDEAIVFFARSARTGDAQASAAISLLRPYYLGQSLLQRGYVRAAVDQMDAFLREPSRLGHIPRLYPEAAMLARQQGRIEQEIGDALCRLGRPAHAAEYYRAAEGDEHVDADALTARLIYVQLATGLRRGAERTLVERLRQNASPASLALVPYLAERGGDRARLVAMLRESYEQSDRPGSLAVAMAEFLTPHEAAAFLTNHLKHRPTDSFVLSRFVARLRAENPASLAGSIVDLIQARPSHAKAFAGEAVRSADDPGHLLDALDRLPPAPRGSAAAFYLRGAAYERGGRVKEAAQAYNQAVAADPLFLPAHLASVELQVRMRRPDLALEMLDKVPAALGGPETRLTRARILGLTGRHDEAIRSIEEMSTADPGNAEFLLELARWQHASKRYGDAEQTLERVLRLDPSSEPAFARLFMLAQEEDNPTADSGAFVELLQRAREQAPSSSVTRIWTAVFEFRNQRLGRAVSILKDLLNERPDEDGALQTLAHIYEGTDRPGEAVDLLLAEARRRPRDPAPLQLLEDALGRDLLRGQGDRKFQPFIERIRGELVGPPVTLARIGFLSRFHLQREEYDQAARVLEEAVGQLPGQAATLHYERAKVRQLQGDEPAAEAALGDVLAVEPDHPGANNDLGYSWIIQDRNLDRALEMVRRAVAAVPNEGAYLDSLGWGYYKLGDFAAAAEQLRKARQTEDGEDPVIIDHLGDTLWRLGEKDEARLQWEEARQRLGPLRIESAVSRERMQVRLNLEAKLKALRENVQPPVAPVAQSTTRNP